jgi:hypothetical protein
MRDSLRRDRFKEYLNKPISHRGRILWIPSKSGVDQVKKGRARRRPRLWRASSLSPAQAGFGMASRLRKEKPLPRYKPREGPIEDLMKVKGIGKSN